MTTKSPRPKAIHHKGPNPHYALCSQGSPKYTTLEWGLVSCVNCLKKKALKPNKRVP